MLHTGLLQKDEQGINVLTFGLEEAFGYRRSYAGLRQILWGEALLFFVMYIFQNIARLAV